MNNAEAVGINLNFSITCLWVRATILIVSFPLKRRETEFGSHMGVCDSDACADHAMCHRVEVPIRTLTLWHCR